MRRRAGAPRAARATVAALVASCALLASCALPPPRSPSGELQVVAAEAQWGSLVAELAGARAHVRSIVANPAADAHDYEATTRDARDVALADVVVLNGVGYDAWASRLVAANPSRTRQVVDAGAVTGTPKTGNPHLWYATAAVRAVVDAATAALATARPQDAGYFRQRREALVTSGLRAYTGLIAAIRARFAGTPVAATESLVEPLAADCRLRIVTPRALLHAVAQGGDVNPRTRADAIAQLRRGEAAVLILNEQNETPDVRALVAAARAARVPIVGVTETPVPEGVQWQLWQVRQLEALERALVDR